MQRGRAPKIESKPSRLGDLAATCRCTSHDDADREIRRSAWITDKRHLQRDRPANRHASSGEKWRKMRSPVHRAREAPSDVKVRYWLPRRCRCQGLMKRCRCSRAEGANVTTE